MHPFKSIPRSEILGSGCNLIHNNVNGYTQEIDIEVDMAKMTGFFSD